MNNVGRPKKNTGYGDMKVVSVNLPSDLVEYVEDIANELNVSRSEVFFNMVATSDREQVKDFNFKLNELISTIKNLKETNKETIKQLNKFTKNMTLRGGLYKPIQKDTKINEFIVENKETFKKVNLDKNTLLNQLLPEYENQNLKMGFEINRSKVRILMEKEILDMIEIVKREIFEKLETERIEKERIEKIENAEKLKLEEQKRIEYELMKENRIERLKQDPLIRLKLIESGKIKESD